MVVMAGECGRVSVAGRWEVHGTVNVGAGSWGVIYSWWFYGAS